MNNFRTRLAAVVVGLGLVATGCADNNTADETTRETKSVTIRAFDYAFTGVPERIEVGTALELTNTSNREAHELVAVRLPDDERRPVTELVKLPQDEFMGLFSGPPALVLVAPPRGGQQVIPVGDGTLKQPGRYLVICGIPTGADPAAFLEAAKSSEAPPQVPGGPPHFTHGMYTELIVE